MFLESQDEAEMLKVLTDDDVDWKKQDIRNEIY